MRKPRTRGAVKLLLVAFLLFIACEARASAPTLISYTEVAWTTTGTPKSTAATVSWQTNDVIVVIAGAEDISTLGVPTATGLTFVVQKQNNPGAAGTCSSGVWAVVAGSAGTNQAVSQTLSSGVKHWGFGVWVWRGSQGIGDSSEQHTATKTVNMTPAAGADAGVVWGAFDFSAGAGPAATPTPTDTRQATVDGTKYSLVVADLTDQVSAGAVAYGLTVTGTTGPYSIVVMEIKTGAGGVAPAGTNKRQKLEQMDPQRR
jgi:hypothetical protein